MKTLLITALFLSFKASAASYTFECSVSHNMDRVIETKVVVGQGERNKSFGEYGDFRFFLSSKGDDIFEVQSYEMVTPARSYSTSKLTEKGSFAELSIWNRDFILDVRCTLL